MVITSWEWLIIIVFLGVLLLWGPQKLPQLAKALGEARREFERASKGTFEEPSVKEETRRKIEESVDEKIIELAKSLGIKTEGKTKEQILKEIMEKTKSKK